MQLPGGQPPEGGQVRRVVEKHLKSLAAATEGKKQLTPLEVLAVAGGTNLAISRGPAEDEVILRVIGHFTVSRVGGTWMASDWI